MSTGGHDIGVQGKQKSSTDYEKLILKSGCSEMYSQRSLSTIFPPHIVASMAFIEKTVSFPWLSLQDDRKDVFKSEKKTGHSES